MFSCFNVKLQNGQPLSNPFKEPNCPEYIMPIQQQAADILFNRSRSVLYLWTLIFTKTKNVMPQQFQLLSKLVRLRHFFNCKSFVVLFTTGVFECFFFFFFWKLISSWQNFETKPIQLKQTRFFYTEHF